MVAEDISIGELSRQIDLMRAEIRDDFAEQRRRQDEFVLKAVYDTEIGALKQRVTDVETEHRRSEESRRAQLKWLVTAIIVPVVTLVTTVVLALRGPA